MKRVFISLTTILAASLAFSQNSTPIGQSSNAFSMLRSSQNQVFVDPTLNVVGFIYRHNVSLYGQSTPDNGRLRFSISTDAGLTWNTELGELNTLYTRRARYPQSLLYNPVGNTNPTDAYIVWCGPTILTGYDGHVTGTCEVTTNNPVTTNETYQFQNSSSGIPGGLCQSTPGIFWMAENATTLDTVFIDSINVYKGTFTAGNVSWVKHTALYSPHSTSFDGEVHLTGPNIAFSNDGQTGYIVFLGDIGTADSTYNPIIYKSTDAGNTWSTGNELHIDQIAGVGDSIKQYVFDTGTAIESCTEVGTTFDFDITVDATNNLHIFTTVCAAERTDTAGVVTGPKQYTVWSAYPKNAVDIYSTDGGITWTSFYVAQVNEFRTTLGAVNIDNFSQISRTLDGNILFYSWSDTDTLVHQGATTNEAPNTFIAGFNIQNGKRTCWKQITSVTNEDFAFSPAMAPYVLEGLNGGPEYTLPIVTQESPTLNDLSFSIYHYVGKGAKFCDEDFVDPVGLDLSWVPEIATSLPHCYNYSACFAIGVENEQTILFNIYPNPTTEILNVQIEDGTEIKNIYVVNALGQTVRIVKTGDLEKGNSILIDVTELAAGMYSVNLHTNSKTYSKKFTVVK